MSLMPPLAAKIFIEGDKRQNLLRKFWRLSPSS
jgi:hypothetical protein